MANRFTPYFTSAGPNFTNTTTSPTSTSGIPHHGMNLDAIAGIANNKTSITTHPTLNIAGSHLFHRPAVVQS